MIRIKNPRLRCNSQVNRMTHQKKPGAESAIPVFALFLSGHLLLLPKHALDIPLGIAFGGVGAFVVLLFPFAEAEKKLCIAVFDVNFQRNDGVALLLGQAEQFTDLGFVQQQLARTSRIDRIEPVPLLERADVHVMDVDFPVPDRRKSVPDVRPSVPKRFDLGPGEHHAGLVGILDEIIMGSFFILGKYLAVGFLRHVHPPHPKLLPELNCINSPGQNQGKPPLQGQIPFPEKDDRQHVRDQPGEDENRKAEAQIRRSADLHFVKNTSISRCYAANSVTFPKVGSTPTERRAKLAGIPPSNFDYISHPPHLAGIPPVNLTVWTANPPLSPK